MLPDEVREAMERAALMAGRDGDWVELDDADWQTIRAHLLAREAEVERLTEDRDSQQRAAIAALARAERAKALLRECRRFVAWASERLPEAMPTYEQLDAHLSENSREV